MGLQDRFPLFPAVCILVSILLARQGPVEGALKKTAVNNDFPDVFDDLGDSYQVSVEVNDVLKKKTDYVSEYHNVVEGDSRLDVTREGKKEYNYLYLNEADEFFIVHDGDCATKRGKDIEEEFRPRQMDLWIYKEDNRLTIGPSAMLRKAFVDKDKLTVGKKEIIRGQNADSWTFANGATKLYYYFTDPIWSNPYGFKNVVPLRVRVERTGASPYSVVYDFTGFQQYVSTLAVFQVPSGIGCKRLSEELPKPPPFLSHDLAYTVELVYSTPENSRLKKDAYVSFVTVVNDLESTLYSYTYTPWILKPKEEPNARNFSIKKIQDAKFGFEYTLMMETGTCYIQRTGDDFIPTIPLPGGEKLAVNDYDFFTGSEGFQYIGEEKVRGFPVKVFEKVKPDFRWPDSKMDPVRAVYTRRYLKNSMDYGSMGRRNNLYIPLQTVLQLFPENGEKDKSATIIANSFAFINEVKQKNVLYDVTACFPEMNQHRWIQFTFSAKEEEIFMLESEEEQIQEQVIAMIADRTNISPLRIPRLLVGFYSKRVYVKCLLLERPPFSEDFNKEDSAMLSSYNVTIGIVRLEDCAKHCLEYSPSCWGYSYCGATCYLSLSQPPPSIPSDRCDFFSRSDDTTIPTADAVVAELSRKFEVSTPYISVDVTTRDGQTQTLKLKMSRFLPKVEVKPYVDILTKDGVEFDDVFEVYKYQAVLDPAVEKMKNFGALSYENCRRVCQSNPNCEVFSFCAYNRQCVHSGLYKEDLPSKSITDNDQCIIMSKRYISKYIHLPGLVMTSKSKRGLDLKDEYQCARACWKEKSFECKSFDFCPSVAGQQFKCLLHEEHMRDVKESGLQVTSSGLCGHYSRNYVFDFQLFPNRKVDSDASMYITETSVDACAKRCAEAGTCVAFDYCTGDTFTSTTCYLITEADGKTATSDSPPCNHYVATAKVTGKDGKNNEKFNRRIYSSATAGGLGFFFFLFGIGIGVVTVLAYGHFKNKKY